MPSAVPRNLRISPAGRDDVPVVLKFIRKLAEYEKLSHEVIADEETLRASLFGPERVGGVLIAYLGEEPVGFAVYFRNFSTFLGRAGLYLEDLFVEPAHRGRGIGKSILVHLAKIAVERGLGRLNWAVLDWNQPAIDFYQRLGAEVMDDWRICRLSGEALARLAEGGTARGTL